MNMQRLLKTAISAGAPFGIVMGLLNAASHGLSQGLVTGVISGLLFGVSLALFVELQRKKMAVTGDYQGEPVLHQGPANHWRGREARGGWLILTPRRLVFRSHGKNLQNAPLELAVAELRGSAPYRSLGIVPNGLRVDLISGAQESFVVSERALWAAQISAAIAGSKALPGGGP